jgi:hypothetical protein
VQCKKEQTIERGIFVKDDKYIYWITDIYYDKSAEARIIGVWDNEDNEWGYYFKKTARIENFAEKIEQGKLEICTPDPHDLDLIGDMEKDIWLWMLDEAKQRTNNVIS